MDVQVELEVCANCKKEIPHTNYVMHTAHCARNISLCPTCKEPFPKSQIESHKNKCVPKFNAKMPVKDKVTSSVEESKYFKDQKAIQDQKMNQRQARRLENMQRFVDCGNELGHYSPTQQNGIDNAPSLITRKNSSSGRQNKQSEMQSPPEPQANVVAKPKNSVLKQSNGTENTTDKRSNSTLLKPTVNFQDSVNFYKAKPSMLPCKYCDLELPKLDLEEHENYCGARTDKCPECGELVMFKYRDLHQDSNHGFLKLNDEPGPKPSWQSPPRPAQPESPVLRNRPPRFNFAYTPSYSINTSYTASPVQTNKNEKLESSKEIGRRLDCKTEYIRNLLHDSASITVPLRSTGAVPRNHFNHNKGGPAPQPPRKRNPPTELVIPCEFCNLPIPHEDLIEHETGCRPDLARFNPRRRSLSPEYVPYPAPGSPEADLPCEFCSDLIPASQLLLHQATCN